MVFRNADIFRGPVLETWKDVTSNRIKQFTLYEIDDAGESVDDYRSHHGTGDDGTRLFA